MLLVRVFYGSRLWTVSRLKLCTVNLCVLEREFRRHCPCLAVTYTSTWRAAHCRRHPTHPTHPDVLRGTPSEAPEAHSLPSGPFGHLAIQSPLTSTLHPLRGLSATTRQVPPVLCPLQSRIPWLEPSMADGVSLQRLHQSPDTSCSGSVPRSAVCPLPSRHAILLASDGVPRTRSP